MKQNILTKNTALLSLFALMIAINAFGQTPTQTNIMNTALGANIAIGGYTWRVADKKTHTDGNQYALLYGMTNVHYARFGATNVYIGSEVRTALTNRYATNSEYNDLRPIAVLATLNNAPNFNLTAKSDLPPNPQLASATGTTVDVIFLPSYGDVKGWDDSVKVAGTFGIASTGQRLITRNPSASPNPVNNLIAFITNGSALTDDSGIAATTPNSSGNLQFRPCIWVRLSPIPPTLGPITTPNPLCAGDQLSLSAPTITDNGSTITNQGWQIETSPGIFTDIALPYPVSDSDNGKKLRYYVTFSGGTIYSNEVTLTVNPSPVLIQPGDITVSNGDNVSAISFNGTNINTVTWQVISGSGTALGMSANSGSGTIPGFTASNATGSALYATIKVTPTSVLGCQGEEKVFTITVTPTLSVYYTQVLTCEPTTEIDVLAIGQYADDRNFMAIQIVKQPAHANPISGLNSNRNVLYTPDAGFTGKDSIIYTIIHTGQRITLDSALLIITVIPCPDNISEAECELDPEGAPWTISELTKSAEGYSPYMTPLIGDIDGDGTIEIIAARALTSLSSPFYDAIQLEIFKGDDLNPVTPWLLDIDSINFTGVGVLAMARINDAPYIYTYAKDGKIHAYNPLTNTKVWVTPAMVMSTAYAEGIAIGLADFDGDGQPELYAGNKIYDAATGVLLWSGSGNSGRQNLTDFNRTVNSAISFASDVTGDGRLNLIAGNQIYDVFIDRITPQLNQAPAITFSGGFDGFTQVADINGDGHLDVIVSRHRYNVGIAEIDVWDVYNNAKLASATIPSPNGAFMSYPFIGDIDNSGRPSIVVVYQQVQGSTLGGYMDAFKYVNGNPDLQKSWASPYPISENYARTGITLFDFNQDGISEIVYRDMQYLRIINGSGIHHVTGLPTAPYNLESIVCSSGTGYEYPVIADVNSDGYAEIITIGGLYTNSYQSSYVRIFGASPAGQPWAPARKVWNQYAYNSLNVNNDLTIPALQMNPAYIFPNGKQPFNSFLQQQTILSKDGAPFWLPPNAVPDLSISNISGSGVSINMTVGIINKGTAALTPPLYISVYKNAIASGNLIQTVSENVQINPGDTAYILINIPDITLHNPVVKLIVNVNDNGTDFPAQPECETSDNDISFINPLLSLMMKKDATLLISPPFQHNGVYSNPVSVLFNEEIEYTISAVNINLNSGSMMIRDTLPLYLNYVPSSATGGGYFTTGTDNASNREYVTWTFSGVAPMDAITVSFKATPADGVCASQPMFINKAWVTSSDTLLIPTSNRTYHQGAGVSVITFSQAVGGSIYNAQEQVLDYKTSPKQGIIVAPDEGYTFTGWSHDAYLSLRGEQIKARSGIMRYDTLTMYGSVNLKANFELEEYPIAYLLNGGFFRGEIGEKGKNRGNGGNPTSYNVKSSIITLEAPEKTGDVFIGWTGANGDEPQMNVTIPQGSTGERTYYANFLYSEHENETSLDLNENDKIWVNKTDLYIRTTKTGSIIRIFTPDGVLYKTQTILTPGETIIKLHPGIYIVTINNSIGKKIILQ